MEYVIIIAVIIIGGLMYFGGRFANFKSQLMNELGKRGMDFKSADALYTSKAHEIHELHHADVPVSIIADLITERDVEEAALVYQAFEYDSFNDWFEAFKMECDRTKAGVSPFLDFMDTSNLQRAYEAGKDPKELAYHFAKDFDPMKIG
jgi:hypothetical protein